MSRLVGWIKGLIVGPNRVPRLWLASLLIAACGLGGLWRTLDEPSLGLRFGVAADGSLQARPDGPTTSQFTHLLGVDRGGRDTLSQVLIGTRMTLFIALVSISLATLIGGALGLIGGYYGGKVGALISGAFDVMIAFPALILALLVVTFYAAEDPSRRVPGIRLRRSRTVK